MAILRKIHRELLPDAEIIVAFDGENGADHRRGQDPGYKAARADVDHTPVTSLSPVMDALTANRISWI